MGAIPVQLREADDRTWIDLERASNLLNLRENTIFGLIRSGKLQSSGSGRSTRVLLGDVRRYDSSRDKRLSAGAKKRWTSSPFSSTEKTKTPPPTEKMETPAEELQLSSKPKAERKVTIEEMHVAAEMELANITERLTTLLVRKAELEEVIAAFVVVRRFSQLDGVRPDDD